SMDVPVNFKFDVRIRARMLNKGTISDADVTKHLEALQDREPTSEVIELGQPALTPPGERPVVNIRPAPRPAPVAALAPPPPPAARLRPPAKRAHLRRPAAPRRGQGLGR